MLTANNISLVFGDKTIFNNISFNINQNQKIGLVGRNGSGKSTLLKVIARQQGLDGGIVSIEKNIKIAYLPQEVTLVSKKTIFDEVLTVFESDIALKKELDELEKYFDSHNQGEVCADKLERYSILQKEVAEKKIDLLIVEAKKMLQWLGFSQDQFEKPVEQLSVGWKMRLVLAKLLLQKADFYLFDEPTNHLDIVAKDWFLEFLKDSKFGFMLVTHDRFFLDNVCDYIFDLDQGNLKSYTANYSLYLEQKEKEKVLLQTKYKEQQKMIKKKTELVDRFRAKATKAKMAQSILKSLEKIEKIEIEHEQKDIKLSFPNVARSGRIVLKVQDLSKKFDDKTVFKNASFELFRGDKAAIVAANGKGKTTLLNLIANKYPLEKGSVEFGHNVQCALFEQDQERCLNKNNTIFEEVESICTTVEMRARVRGLLGTFLFPGDDVDKKIAVLSGGEKNRVAMVKVLLQQANFLILDEPTNHLDIQSKDILLKALQQYPGTLLFVSHDRMFVDNLATRIFELNFGEVVSFPGNYESYLYHKKQQEIQKQEDFKKSVKEKKSIKSKVDNKEQYLKRKEINSLERKINSLEKKLNQLYEKFSILEYGTKEFDESSKRIEEIKSQLDNAFLKWEELQK